MFLFHTNSDVDISTMPTVFHKIILRTMMERGKNFLVKTILIYEGSGKYSKQQFTFYSDVIKMCRHSTAVGQTGFWHVIMIINSARQIDIDWSVVIKLCLGLKDRLTDGGSVRWHKNFLVNSSYYD